MNKRLIPWNEFESAVSAEALWLLNGWVAFTEEGVVLVSQDQKPEKPAFNRADRHNGKGAQRAVVLRKAWIPQRPPRGCEAATSILCLPVKSKWQ
jgi:hypothetical protein